MGDSFGSVYGGMNQPNTAQALKSDVMKKLDLIDPSDDFANWETLNQSIDENYQRNKWEYADLKPGVIDKLKKQYSQIGEILSDKYFEPANREIAKINALIMGTPTLEEGGDKLDLKTHDDRAAFNYMMESIEDAQKRNHRLGLRQTAPSSYVGENIPGRTFLNAMPPAAAAALGPIGDVVDIATGMQDAKSDNPVKKAAGVLNVGAGTSGIAAMAGGINPLIPLTLGSVGATTEVLSDPTKRDAAFNLMRSRGPLIMPRY